MTFTTTVKWKNEVENLKEMGRKQMTLQQIGDCYGVSRERIRQILRKYVPNWRECFGVALRVKLKNESIKIKQYERWGVREDNELYRACRRKFLAKKNNASRVGCLWNVTFGEIDWPSHCPILGIELDYFAEKTQENSPSFDQKIPSLGYVKGNVQVLSWRANRIKNDGTAEEHKLISDHMFQYEMEFKENT